MVKLSNPFGTVIIISIRAAACRLLQRLRAYSVKYKDTGETETDIPAEWIRDAA